MAALLSYTDSKCPNFPVYYKTLFNMFELMGVGSFSYASVSSGAAAEIRTRVRSLGGLLGTSLRRILSVLDQARPRPLQSIYQICIQKFYMELHAPLKIEQMKKL